MYKEVFKINYFELGSFICRNVYKENNFSKDHLENGVALGCGSVRWSTGRRKRAMSETLQREEELGLVSARKGREQCWLQSSPEFPSCDRKLLCYAEGWKRPGRGQRPKKETSPIW